MSINNLSEGAAITSGKHISVWTDTAIQPELNPLIENLETEVVIIGGGLAGMSIAYNLTQAGKRVVLVEDGNIGSGETGRTTAHLVTALDERYYELEKLFGEENTKLIAESHMSAIDFVERTVRLENIDCDFERVKGYLFLHPSDKADALERELLAAHKAGVEVSILDNIPGLSIPGKSICYHNQAQFHPLKYLNGLRIAIERNGGKIFTGTHASEINHEGITSTEGRKIKAKHVVVATNSPVNNVFVMFERQFAYRTYVIAASIKKDTLPKALWWDTGNFDTDPELPPYHYIRVQSYNATHDLLICGGEDHPTGSIKDADLSEEKRYQALELWTREHFNIEEIIYQWSGQVIEPMDGLAFIGRNPMDHKNVYIVTGDSGNGMTHCTIAGMLITDLIIEKENKWEKIYRPSRFTFRESGQMFKQMMHEFLTYMKQTPNFKGVEELSAVKKGEGKIVDMLEEKFGVYREENGKLNIVSAECTHLKCTLAWNKDELSWDCPCHGSRFTYEGIVMNGPANRDLPFYTEGELK